MENEKIKTEEDVLDSLYQPGSSKLVAEYLSNAPMRIIKGGAQFRLDCAKMASQTLTKPYTTDDLFREASKIMDWINQINP